MTSPGVRATAREPDGPILSARGIAKSYGGTVALHGVDLDLAPGEVHALVGENGAGKSTLLKILAGAERRDRGEMTLAGTPYRPAGLKEAEARGVALVFQEPNVARTLTVAENVFLDHLRDFTRLGLVDWRRLRREAEAVLDDLGAGVSVTDEVDALDLGRLKLVEVARALALRPRIVFFDESTAYLNNAEMRALLAGIGRLRAAGIAVAFVSHHLQEVFEVADRVTVLKDGSSVGTFAVGEVDEDRLHRLMVGRELGADLYPGRTPRAPSEGEPALRLSGVVYHPLDGRPAGPFDLDLPPGRIVGLGGLKGSGGEALLEGLAGLHPLVAGEAALGGAPHRPRSPAEAWAAGVAYLPGDRGEEGLIPDFAVAENVTMAVRPSRRGLVDRAREGELTTRAIADLRIRTPGGATPAADLSGGNMQKVVLAKCLAAGPRLLLLNNPTRGVDVGAKAEIYGHMRRLAEDGMAVLMVSEDLPELLGVADRVAITKGGRVSKIFPWTENPSEEDAVRWML